MQIPIEEDMKIEVPALKPGERKLVTKVTECYQKMRYLPPVVSQNLDDLPGAQSMKWTPSSCHFVVDVRNALQFAIANQPDRPELIKAWTRLLLDSTQIGESEVRLIRLLAPVLRDRNLEPWSYFTGRRRIA
jgi:hypothetical protein